MFFETMDLYRTLDLKISNER